MEQFVLGIFQEQLSKFIVGFRKEQVNANLLNGKGEIRDVNLNCSFINRAIVRVTPFIELESINVSKLSFCVTSWTNIKKAPIILHVEDVVATVVEPLHYLDPSQRRKLQQLTQAQLKEFLRQQNTTPRGPYNFLDRILDNLQLEIRSVRLTFQPRGKFKTRRTGPWTPPQLCLTLRHLRYVSVDEFGNEASPDDCWRHNERRHHQQQQQLKQRKERTLLIYKKASMQFSLEVLPNGIKLPPLIRDCDTNVHIAFHKRVRDAATLGIQLDCTLQKLLVQLSQQVMPHLAHLATGMKYCMAKDRVFEEPLVCGSNNQNNATGTETGIKETTKQEQEKEKGADATENTIKLQRPTKKDDADNSLATPAWLKNQVSEDSDDEMPPEQEKVSLTNEDTKTLPSADEEDDEEEVDDGIENNIDPEQTPATVDNQPTSSLRQEDRPVIVTPGGIIIHEKICVTMAIHDCQIRGDYHANAQTTDQSKSDDDLDSGYLQIDVKGIVAELLWPKVSGEKGACLQASIAYVAIRECHESRMRTILRGGVQHNIGKGPVTTPTAPKFEVAIDEFFPLFEDRCLRPDPLDLRHLFPAQAIGCKTTISFQKKISDPTAEEVHVLNEVGIDRIDIILDFASWSRIGSFALNEKAGGFDPRWDSGDWSDELTPQMLVHPNKPLDLDQHLQQPGSMFLDENDLISSDLFNLTAKISAITLRVPAAIQQDPRSCDVVFNLGEMVIVVSSALPRTFLNGKLGTSVLGDGAEKSSSKIVFPNDPSDICYALDDHEDPLIRQQGTMTSGRISTFRLQLTCRGLSLSLVPVVPFCNALEPQRLLAPTELTFILCFEGEPPETQDSDRMKIRLFFTMQIHELIFNCDLDILAGALCTLIHQSTIAHKAVQEVGELPLFSKKAPVIQEDDKVPSSMKGRRIMVVRQLKRSQHTGGLAVEFYVQLAALKVRIWRQNVSVRSNFRESVFGKTAASPLPPSTAESSIPLVKLLDVTLESIEASVEGNEQHVDRRGIIKLCLESLKVGVCDFDAECLRHQEMLKTKEALQAKTAEDDPLEEIENGIDEDVKEDPLMKTIISFEGIEPRKGFVVRCEDWRDIVRSMSIAGDIDIVGALNLHLAEIEMLFLLLVEGFLMPTNAMLPDVVTQNTESQIFFPSGSIGFFFASGVSFLHRARGDKKKVNGIGNGIFHGGELDAVKAWHAFLKSKLPSDLSRLLVRFSLGKLSLHVPHDNRDDSICSFDLSLERLLVRSGYFDSSQMFAANQIMNVFAAHGKSWAEEFSRKDVGFQHKISSSQSMSAMLSSNDTRTLIPTFEVGAEYFPHNVNVSMNDSNLSVQELESLSELRTNILAFKERIVMMSSRIESVVLAMKRRGDTSTVTSAIDGVSPPFPTRKSNYGASLDAERAISNGRSSFEQLKLLIEKHDGEMRRQMQQQKDLINELQAEIFLKERSRLAALALLSCQAAGWLRVGGMHIYGQRAPSTSTMWRYHVVLRKSLLILYSNPGKPRPLDVVCLQGARLMSLAGGRRKQDIRHGFALCERAGMVRFFIAPSGNEFENWVREIQRAINKYTAEELLMEADPDFSFLKEDVEDAHNAFSFRGRARTTSSELDVSETGAEGISQGAHRGQAFRARLSTMTANARSKVEGVVQRGRQQRLKAESFDSASEDDNAAIEQERHADVESAASLPSVQESDSVANFDVAGQVISSEPPVESSNQEAGESKVVDEPPMGDDSEGDGRGSVGLRFASMRSKALNLGSTAKNRFGSAMEAAREKTKAVADERRRKRDNTQEKNEGGGFRGRFGSVAANMINRISVDDNKSATEAQIAPTANDNQTSETRTVASRGGSVDYSVDGDKKEQQDGDQDQGESHDAGEKEQVGSRGQQFRDRMSKFGSSLRQTTQTQRSANNDDDSSRTIFSIRRFRNQDANDEVSDFVKLKSLLLDTTHPGSGNEAYTHPSDDVEYEKLRGKWTIAVLSVLPQKEAAMDGVDQDVIEEVPIEQSDTFNKDKRIFRIKIFSPDPSEKNLSLSSVDRTFTDVVKFYIRSSESVGAMENDLSLQIRKRIGNNDKHEEFETIVGDGPLDMVKLTFDMFGGLLDTNSNIQSMGAYHSYQCEVLAEFLNSLLACPLSECLKGILLEFLELSEFTLPYPSNGAVAKCGVATHQWNDFMNEIMSLSLACHSDLLSAESSLISTIKSNQAHNIDNQQAPSNAPPASAIFPFLEPLLPQNISDGLRDAMHEALMAVMAERDYAQAQLVAASVLHVHELESQRKKIVLLQEKLKFTQEESKVVQKQGLFGSRRMPDKETKSFHQFQEEVIHSTDSELTTLCQQLAGEISAKTAASLEVVRLKQSRKIEQEQHAAEREALREELRKVKAQLEAEKAKNAIAK